MQESAALLHPINPPPLAAAAVAMPSTGTPYPGASCANGGAVSPLQQLKAPMQLLSSNGSSSSSSSSICMYPYTNPSLSYQDAGPGHALTEYPLFAPFFPFAGPFKTFENGNGNLNGNWYHQHPFCSDGAAPAPALLQMCPANANNASLLLHSPTGPLVSGPHTDQLAFDSYLQQPQLHTRSPSDSYSGIYEQPNGSGGTVQALADAGVGGAVALPAYPTQSESASSGFLSNCYSCCAPQALAVAHPQLVQMQQQQAASSTGTLEGSPVYCSSTVSVYANGNGLQQLSNGAGPRVQSGVNGEHQQQQLLAMNYSMPEMVEIADAEDVKPSIPIPIPIPISIPIPTQVPVEPAAEARAGGAGDAPANGQAPNKVQLLADRCLQCPPTNGHSAPIRLPLPLSLPPDVAGRAVDCYMLSEEKLVEHQLLEIERSILDAYRFLDSINVRVCTLHTRTQLIIVISITDFRQAKLILIMYELFDLSTSVPIVLTFHMRNAMT